MPGLGDEFRAAREARHLSLSDVSEQIHIRSIYLQSIEDGDPSFAAPVYVRGFIRTYARFLGLDPATALAQFNTSSNFAPTKGHEPIAISARRRGHGPSPWFWLAVAVATVLVGFVGFKYVDSWGAPPATVVESASPAARSASAAAVSAPARTSARASAPAAKRTLEVRVTQDSWMSVRIDGVPVLAGIIKAGTTKAFHGKSADVRAGNAGGVDLTLNGKELGKMGKAGDVVERNLTLAEK